MAAQALALALAGLLAAAESPELTAALKLYDDLEFQAALEQLRKAEPRSAGPAEDVVIHTYEGIIEYTLDQPQQAEGDFKVALSLDLGAKLPGGVSPKIRAQWERVRAELARAQVPRSAPPAVAAEPARPAAPELGAPRPTEAVAAPPAGGLKAHLPALATAGGGLALGAAGLVVGLVAHSTGAAARSDEFQSAAAAHLAAARSQQVVAWALLGTGGAALLAGGALYLLASRPTAAGP